MSLNFRAMAGTYQLRFNAIKASNRAILDVDMDAGEIGSFDLYAIGNDQLNIEQIAGIILTAGAHTLRFRVDGRNGLAIDWIVSFQGISLVRTA